MPITKEKMANIALTTTKILKICVCSSIAIFLFNSRTLYKSAVAFIIANIREVIANITYVSYNNVFYFNYYVIYQVRLIKDIAPEFQI